jgi:hypothetical protein
MRVDRITRWEPTGFRFSEKALESDPTIPNRNSTGDDSMVKVYAVAKFDKVQPIKKDNTAKTVTKDSTVNTVNKDNTNNAEDKQNPTGYDK